MSQLTTLARPYAKAAFKTAIDAGSLQTWSQGLSLLAALLQDAKVGSYLANPALGAEQQTAVLLSLCGEELDSKMHNIVSLLADNKRLTLLPEISALFEGFKAESEKTIEVEVVSAFSLDTEAEQQLAVALKTRLQREIKLSSSVDSSLIGGMIVRAGDLVIDGSVRGKLKKLTETMNA